jgi:hypothetical protein
MIISNKLTKIIKINKPSDEENTKACREPRPSGKERNNDIFGKSRGD